MKQKISKEEKRQNRVTKHEARKAERAKRKARKAAEHRRPSFPRMSPNAIWYTFKIYSKAVGFKRYFFWFYQFYSSIVPPVTALLAGEAVTRITVAITTRDFIPFLWIAVILLAIQLVNTVLGQINNLLQATTWQDVYIYVSEKIATKYIEIPLSVRESQSFADKFNRVQDYGSMITSVANSLISIITSVISLISVLVATLAISPIVTIAVAAAAVPYSVLSLKLAARQRRNWREFTKDRRIAYQIEQKITSSNSALEIELNDLSHQLIERMIKARRRSQEKDLADTREFFWPNIGSRTVEDVVSYLVLIFVAIEIILGRFAIGQFLAVRSLLTQLSGNISSLFFNIANASEGLVNATDFMEFMETPAKNNGDIIVDSIPKIEFRNVSFIYPRSDRKALDNISFTINPGDSLAIVGENGAGKTTLIKLLIGAYQPTEGQILINDLPIERIERSSYLSQIGALFQDYTRYEFATLGENVWFGDVSQPYNTAKIKEALDLAGLSDIVSKYKRGLNQVLSKDLDLKNSADLSGGQWQRLGIARAFFRQPGILILDEPTSAVDAKAEYQIFRNILQRQKDRTTIIISHRFSTVRKAEKILVLESGKIKEQGTHEELIANDSLYKEMFELQAEGYN